MYYYKLCAKRCWCDSNLLNNLNSALEFISRKMYPVFVVVYTVSINKKESYIVNCQCSCEQKKHDTRFPRKYLKQGFNPILCSLCITCRATFLGIVSNRTLSYAFGNNGFPIFEAYQSTNSLASRRTGS